jgi:hypothetical protein
MRLAKVVATAAATAAVTVVATAVAAPHKDQRSSALREDQILCSILVFCQQDLACFSLPCVRHQGNCPWSLSIQRIHQNRTRFLGFEARIPPSCIVVPRMTCSSSWRSQTTYPSCISKFHLIQHILWHSGPTFLILAT